MPDTVGVGTRIIALLSTTVLTFPDWLSQLLNRSFSRTKSYSLPVFQAIGQPFHLAGGYILFMLEFHTCLMIVAIWMPFLEKSEGCVCILNK